MLRYCVGVALLLLLALSACGSVPSFIARYEPWRAEEERACLASGLVHETPPFVTVRSTLGGPSVCGAIKPFKVAATARGVVALQPAALLRCPMVHALEHWTKHVVVPAAHFHLDAKVVGLKIAGSYSCRPMNGVDGALLSEHGHANAIDISGFVLEDGRTVSLEAGWRGTTRERRFLRAAQRGACGVFTTVLGPDYDRRHHDHFHLDLARRTDHGRICK